MHAVICIYVYISCITDAAEILEPSIERTVNIVEGQKATFMCMGVGYPPPLVQWRKFNGSLSNSLRVFMTKMSMLTNEGNVTRVIINLIFTGAYREDTGVYECSAINLLNNATRNVSLIVQCKRLNNYLLYVTNLEKIRLPRISNL